MSNIIGNLPVALSNGTTADASQVMADLNFIVNQVNANALPNGASSMPNLAAIGPVPTLALTVTYDPGLQITNTSGADGAVLMLLGNGPTTPSKRIRVTNGVLQVVNDTNTTVLTSIDDAGNLMAKGNLSASGSAFITGSMTVGGDITAQSDRRTKSRIKRIRNATETVLAWVGITFQRKGDKTKRRHAGFVADDMPAELVHTDENGIKSLAYGNATAYLAEAFKELESRVRKLEAAK
ncbi:tail fiber domain-containing protein [Burkholderia vietnamiensis]|uniref:tail fiber domain-containing protein n=1 Tax=Burkholderia vietnamiensis TaxID=60552 RepID=UPI001CF3D325|nr:tail fiber domain-containing protein [Burkholderia vietnamiensis]MCA8391505.1 tail fiber domain-containing protein [Burkholderia vietnamiensis]HDR8957028.1 tail fiber domain-containing protein [Burkholderia vietnamiensis]HDR9243657.1 tail fiber domain-containing protein [Burkholderia vietnamiensis]